MKTFSKTEAQGNDYLEVEARPLHLLNQSYKTKRNEGSRISYQQQQLIRKEEYCQHCTDLKKQVQAQNEQIHHLCEELRAKKEPFLAKTPEKMSEHVVACPQEELRIIKADYLRLKKSAEETQEQLEEAWFQESELKHIIQEIQDEFKIQREKEELEWKQKIQKIENESRELMDKAEIRIEQAEISKEEAETELAVQAAEWEAERNCSQMEFLQAKETILQLKRKILDMNQPDHNTKGFNQNRHLIEMERYGEEDFKYGYEFSRRQEQIDQENELKESLDLQDQIIQLAQQQRKANNIQKDKRTRSSARRRDSIYQERCKDDDQYYFSGENSSQTQKQKPGRQLEISSQNYSSNKLDIEQTIQRLENEVISIQNSLSADCNPRLNGKYSNKRNSNLSQSFAENYQESRDYEDDQNQNQKLTPPALNTLRSSLNGHSCSVCSTNKMCQRASRMKALLQRYEHLTNKTSNQH